MKIHSKKNKLSKLNQNLRNKSENIEDSRFQSVHYDPKFLPASKKISKTQIDSRFSNLFSDKRFQIVSEKDKYGREIELPEINEDMERLYYIEEENPEEKSSKTEETSHKTKKKIKINEKIEEETSQKKSKKLENSSKIEEETSQKKSKKLKKKSVKIEEETSQKKSKKPAKIPRNNEEIQSKYYNEQGKFEWKEESSSEEAEESVEEIEANVWDDDEEEGVIKSEATSSRLSLLNYDWTHINAEDLMALFNSLKPEDSIIKKITIYPSEFGLKRLEKENKEGPSEIWETNEENAVISEEKESKNSKNPKKKHQKVEKEINDWISKVNKPTEFDPIKLRKYERDRLKYYYAIIDCDTKKTAELLYKECDGTEFELSGMKIDLRFVPEDQKFPYEPKDICDYIPVTNKVNNFFNRALNHTNVELTWENPNMNRFDFLYNKNMTEEDWNKVDYSKILGQCDESENENDENEENDENDENGENSENGENITKKIVEEKKDWRSDFDKKNKRKFEEEMEIKFTSGFTDIGNKMLEKSKEKEESTWEKYLKKRKEKKQAKKLLEKNKMKEDDYFVEPEVEEKDEEKYENEMKLLVDDEKKNKDFDVDLKDERFNAIYEDSKYGINPTHKDFTIEGSGKYLKEVVDRRKKTKKNF